MTASTAALRRRFEAAMMRNYGTPGLALSHGEGRRVTDADGATYLDMVAGIAVSALGHAHPALVQAVADQAAQLIHTSNLYLHEGEVALAEELLALLDAPGRVFLANSGTEANEAALKVVRRAHPDRPRFLAAQDGFHGRSAGALALTGKDAIRRPFAPFGPQVEFVPYGDLEAMSAAMDSDCAGVFLEPTQGEAGVVPPPAGYLAGVRALCDRHGTALVLDEIQSGIGRTGHWFAHQAEGVAPDVLTLAKGLGGGMPIGACVGFGDYAVALGPGDHGSTFGGNPVAVAAARAVLRTIDAEGLVANAAEQGRALREGLAAAARRPQRLVRGNGLWLGVELDGPHAPTLHHVAAEHGILVNAVAPTAIRLAPALNITPAEVAEFLQAWPKVLADTGDAVSDNGGTS